MLKDLKAIFFTIVLMLTSSMQAQTDIVEYLSGSTVKISQFVGDYDRQRQAQTLNFTESKYGPYQFEDLATGNDSTTTIYFTLSTWNPYTVVLMKSTLKLSNSPTSIGVGNFAVPTGFHLEQNYPNPFNPTTTIRFSLPQREHIKLQIFNMRGKEVATLVDGMFSQGSHAVTFESKDLSSGIYLYRLVYGQQIQYKKMLLIK